MARRASAEHVGSKAASSRLISQWLGDVLSSDDDEAPSGSGRTPVVSPRTPAALHRASASKGSVETRASVTSPSRLRTGERDDAVRRYREALAEQRRATLSQSELGHEAALSASDGGVGAQLGGNGSPRRTCNSAAVERARQQRCSAARARASLVSSEHLSPAPAPVTAATATAAAEAGNAAAATAVAAAAAAVVGGAAGAAGAAPRSQPRIRDSSPRANEPRSAHPRASTPRAVAGAGVPGAGVPLSSLPPPPPPRPAGLVSPRPLASPSNGGSGCGAGCGRAATSGFDALVVDTPDSPAQSLVPQLLQAV